MAAGTKLEASFALAARYVQAFEAYQARGLDRTLDPEDKEWPDDQAWRIPHYFHAGADALRLIVAALIVNLRDVPRRILDFPSGSGRVTRHLRAFFPDAEIWACDLDEGHIAFCAKHLGARPQKSVDDLSQLVFEQDFDLVFCGSLLTHLPQEGAIAALNAIVRALGPTGIALVTFQGRHAEHVQRHQWKYLEDERFAIAERQVRQEAFGFVDYRGEFRTRFENETPYGIALVRPSWVMRHLEANPHVRILGYAERAWDDHQDVVVFGRPGVNE
jgi:SAM-dependent methyltransferase